jgi:DNA mismatch endonuclease (patch repair protein)
MDEAVKNKSMQGNKRRDTRPELEMRRLLREAGFPGYRLQWKKVPGRPDIAYPGRKVAIFVNGCFWHRCPRCNLPLPKSNREFWEAKFKRNVERDRRKIEELEALGWKVLVVWECELKDERRRSSIEYAFISLTNEDAGP